LSIIEDDCSDATLESSESCSLCVRFTPTDQGATTASISIPSNDPDSETVSVSVTGTGYGLNAWISNIDCDSCPSISFDIMVTDYNNNIINTLAEENVLVYLDGELQDITLNPIVSPAPVTFVMALDWSGSTYAVRDELLTSAKSSIDQMTEEDFAAICKFSGSAEFYPSSAPLLLSGTDANKTNLKAYLDQEYTVVSGTALYDTIISVVDRVTDDGAGNLAVIVICDGRDNVSTATLDEAILYANEFTIPIFAIYCADPTYVGNPEVMQQLASDTGGQYYNADTVDLADIFQQISNTISNRYTIEFTSPTCTGTSSLVVRVDDEASGYYGQGTATVSFGD
jgi:VWFA-related protein